jgi:hypothetical protein
MKLPERSGTQFKMKERGINHDMKPPSLLLNDAFPDVTNLWLPSRMQLL